MLGYNICSTADEDIKKLTLNMMKILILLYKGLQLFFILPLCALSKRMFTHFWKKYYKQPLEPNLFSLCVQWLLYNGEKMDLSYERINSLIFCIVWPAITIVSIALNIILLLML